MTNIQRIRDLIGDSHKSDIVSFVGDGDQVSFQLPRRRIKTDSINAGSYTVDTVDYETGLVTLEDAPEEHDKFQVSFYYSSFRDEEIEDYLDINHTVNRTAIALLQILLADTARRYDYSTGLEQFKPSQVFDQIEGLIERIKKEDNDLSSSGGVVQEERTSEYGNLNNLYTDNEPTGY